MANLADDAEKQDDAPAFVKELVRPINAQAGDLLKVSDFVKHGTVDGSWEVLGQAKRPKVERVLLPTRNAVSRPSFLHGTRTTVSSVTSVPTSVLTLPSVRSC